MIDKTIRGSVKVWSVTMFLVQSVYLLLSLCAILNYGSIIASVVLVDIGKEMPIKCVSELLTPLKVKPGDKLTIPDYYVKELGHTLYPENYVMQFLFLIILACHIPYLFFSGKEAILIIIDEVMRKSISLVLSKKLLQENADEINAMPELPEDEKSGSASREMSKVRGSNAGSSGQIKI
jgi:hypothetical protein